MKELAKKLQKVEIEIAKEKGRLSLFALLLREESDDRWDLLVSASWVPSSERDALSYINDKLKCVLTEKDIIRPTALNCFQSQGFEVFTWVL